MTSAPGLDENRLRRLAATRGRPVLTSLYLDVDGRRYPRHTDYEPPFAALCHAARQQSLAWGEDAARAVDADLDRMRRWLDAGVDRSTTRGLALFSCSGTEWFDVVALPAGVEDRVLVAPEPDVSQLVELLQEQDRVLVVLADRREARLIRVDIDGREELARVVDELERDVDTDVEVGGWEHRREEARRRHFRRVAAAVRTEAGSRGATRIVLGGSDDDVAALRHHLAPDVLALVAATVTLPISAEDDAVDAAAASAVEAGGRAREAALLARLDDARRRGRAAVGVAAVMAALADRRVATLVVARGLATKGARCPACGHVGAPACHCPACGTPSVEADDVADVAIDEALAEGADVAFCGAAGAVAFGGIAAVTRY
ncbi:MAG TPA: hypothetical protein VMU14_10165 [Acidimicrobiales bacterium]|nr:hypothetical protein [Acidimicrobiales bacterium]